MRLDDIRIGGTDFMMTGAIITIDRSADKAHFERTSPTTPSSLEGHELTMAPNYLSNNIEVVKLRDYHLKKALRWCWMSKNLEAHLVLPRDHTESKQSTAALNESLGALQKKSKGGFGYHSPASNSPTQLERPKEAISDDRIKRRFTVEGD